MEGIVDGKGKGEKLRETKDRDVPLTEEGEDDLDVGRCADHLEVSAPI